jgi:hypothetical protein
MGLHVGPTDSIIDSQKRQARGNLRGANSL